MTNGMGTFLNLNGMGQDYMIILENGHRVYCNMSQKPFYESMPMEPELVLSDFVKVFHPELLPDYQPHYYEILK